MNNQNNNLSSKVSDILLEQCQDDKLIDISKSVDKYLEISEEMLIKLSLIRKNRSWLNDSNNQKIRNYTINDFEIKYNEDIIQIEAIISGAEDLGIRTYTNYLKLQHNYYKVLNEMLNCKTNLISKMVKNMDATISSLDSKSKSIEEKFEGIGSTILSTVVSLTVIVTAITALDKIPTIFIPMYLVFMVWLGMTFIVFITNLFNKKDFNSKQAKGLYIIISIFALLLLISTLFYMYVHNIDISKTIKQITEEKIIDNSSKISQ